MVGWLWTNYRSIYQGLASRRRDTTPICALHLSTYIRESNPDRVELRTSRAEAADMQDYLVASSISELSAGCTERTKFPRFTELQESHVSNPELVESKVFQLRPSIVQKVLINSVALQNISRAQNFLRFKQKQEQLTQKLRSAIQAEELDVLLHLYNELMSENLHGSSVLSPNVIDECRELVLPFVQDSAIQHCRQAMQKDNIFVIFDLIELLTNIGFYDVVGRMSELICADLSARFLEVFAETCSMRTRTGERINIDSLNVLYSTLHKFTETFNHYVRLGKANIYEPLIMDIFNTWGKLVGQFLIWFNEEIAVIDLNDSLVQVAQLDAAIEDIIIVHRICKAQHSLFRKQTTQIIHNQIESISKLSPNFSAVLQYLTRLAESCVQFETVYIRKSLQTIHAGVDAAASMRSIDIDDLFFLIGRSIRRVFGLTSVRSVCSLIANVCDILNYFAETNLKPGMCCSSEIAAGKSFPDMTGATVEHTEVRMSGTVRDHQAPKMHDLFVPLNVADLLLTRILQITQEVESLASSIFVVEEEKMKVLQSLELLERASRDLRQQRDSFFVDLSRVRIHYISPVFEHLACSSYIISEEVYRADNQVQSWVDSVLAYFYHDFRAVSEVASSENVQLFVTHSSEGLSKRLENIVKTRLSFNHLGSLKFERELRQLISGLSSLTHFRVREAFATLVQITVLLSAETRNEADNYLVDMRRQATWKLSESDVLHVMKLRVDL